MRQPIKSLFLVLLLGLFLIGNLPTHAAQITPGRPPRMAQFDARDVAMAYVHENTVKLADAMGNELAVVGPDFSPGQIATLFWSPDGERLYIARRDGLYETGAEGAPSVKVPGNYGITLTFDHAGGIIYYMESTSPANTDDPNFVTFPLREANLQISQGGTGRLVSYIGNFSVESTRLTIYGAAMQYARDGGLLGAGRPRLFPTYGATMFYSCCFPDAGLNAIDLPSGAIRNFDNTFIPGAAAVNSTQSRLAGPTTEGNIRLIDLISGGTRDYPANIGVVERITWDLEDGALYLVARQNPLISLDVNPLITEVFDNQSANIFIWKLDLVSGQFRELAELGDFYGVSSITATRDYVFVTAVESNKRLIDDLNTGRLPQDMTVGDARLTSEYLTNTVLFRIAVDGSDTVSILGNVWGLTARPRH